MAPARLPWAQRQQTETGPIDRVLLARARHNKPPVSWWWGRTWRKGHMRLVCYVCGEILLDTTPAFALSADGVATVMEHRAFEIERTRPHVHRTTGETT